MRKVIVSILCIVALAACQKEPDLVDPGGSPTTGGGTGTGGTTNPNGTRLVRIGTRIGTDTLTSGFSYNGNGSLHVFSQSGIATGIQFTGSIRTVRNAAGIITSTIRKANVLAQFGIDSVVTRHTYDASVSRYRYSVTRSVDFNLMDADSTVYTYNPGGQLTSAISYLNDGSGFEEEAKSEFTYAGANIAIEKTYSSNGSGGWDLDETLTHEYDAKISPTSFPADAPILGMRVFYSANNPVKSTTVAGGATDVRNITYTYNTTNRPLTTVVGAPGGAAASTNTYTYQ